MPKRKPAPVASSFKSTKSVKVATFDGTKKKTGKKDFSHLLAKVSVKPKQKEETFLDKVGSKIKAIGGLLGDVEKAPLILLTEGPEGVMHLHDDMEEHLNELLGNENVKKLSKVLNTILNEVEAIVKDPSELVDLLHKLEETTLGGAALTLLETSFPEFSVALHAFEGFLDVADMAVEAIKYAADPEKTPEKLAHLKSELAADAFDLAMTTVQAVLTKKMPDILNSEYVPTLSAAQKKFISSGATQAANYAETVMLTNDVLSAFGVNTATTDTIARKAGQLSGTLEKVGVKGTANADLKAGVEAGKEIREGAEQLKNEVEQGIQSVTSTVQGALDQARQGEERVKTVLSGARQELVKTVSSEMGYLARGHEEEEPEIERLFEAITNIEFDTPFLNNPPNSIEMAPVVSAPVSVPVPKKSSLKRRSGDIGSEQTFYAAYAAAVYSPPAERDSMVQSLTTHDTGTLIFNEPHDAAWLRNDTIIIAFRGTILSEAGDILSDATIGVGREFLGPRFVTGEALVKKVQKEHPGKKLIFTGHSLGGTVAYYLREHADKVYTYNMGTNVLNEISVGNVVKKAFDFLFSKKNKNATNYYVPGDIISAGVMAMEGGVPVKQKQGLSAHDKNNFL